MNLHRLYEIFLRHPVISTDSRNVAEGSLFFALRGEQFNGNRFAAEALEKGAAYAIVDDAATGRGEPYIQVEDSLRTLQELATHHRQQLKIPVLAITGTNGKTTTKELTAAVLATRMKTGYSRGNLNNHIGVPLTLLSLTTDTEIAVVEMGANHPGEIAFLCRIARPDFGLVTNVGKAHLEGLGSLRGVIETKSELYRFLENNNGILFINGDNPLLGEAAGDRLRKVQYGQSDKNSIRGIQRNEESLFLALDLWFYGKGPFRVNSRLTGRYNLENITAAAAIGDYFGISPENICAATESYRPSNFRSQITRAGSNTLLMDGYNANPSSMMAALSAFLQLEAATKVVILGDMLELGGDSAREHQQIADYLAAKESLSVFLVGDQFCQTATPPRFLTYTSTEDLIGHLKEKPVANSLVLIKGSRGMKMEKVYDCLIDLGSLDLQHIGNSLDEG